MKKRKKKTYLLLGQWMKCNNRLLDYNIKERKKYLPAFRLVNEVLTVAEK